MRAPDARLAIVAQLTYRDDAIVTGNGAGRSILWGESGWQSST
jgi:hypothetical protein